MVTSQQHRAANLAVNYLERPGLRRIQQGLPSRSITLRDVTRLGGIKRIYAHKLSLCLIMLQD